MVHSNDTLIKMVAEQRWQQRRAYEVFANCKYFRCPAGVCWCCAVYWRLSLFSSTAQAPTKLMWRNDGLNYRAKFVFSELLIFGIKKIIMANSARHMHIASAIVTMFPLFTCFTFVAPLSGEFDSNSAQIDVSDVHISSMCCCYCAFRNAFCCSLNSRACVAAVVRCMCITHSIIFAFKCEQKQQQQQQLQNEHKTVCNSSGNKRLAACQRVAVVKMSWK